MIPWWVAIITLFVGVIFGFILLGIVTAGNDQNE